MKTRNDAQPRQPARDRRADQRRGDVRRPASAAPDLKARLASASTVRLLNISRRGVLLETDARLTPHSVIAIRFVASRGSLLLKGCVVRSSVAMLTGETLTYKTALSLDQDLSVCDETLWREDAAPETDTASSIVQESASGDDEAARQDRVVIAPVDEQAWIDLSRFLSD